MFISIKKRLLFFFIAMLFFLGVFYLGFTFKMDESFSKELSKNFMSQIRDIDEFGIFFNNLKIALVMFIPAIGIVMGTISGFSTGLVFNSIMNISITGNSAVAANPINNLLDTIWNFGANFIWFSNFKGRYFVI